MQPRVRADRYTGGMKVGFSVAHHDHGYVKRRGGQELLAHMSGASARAGYRVAAIARSLRAYEQADDAGKPATEVGGLALIVVQRALLAAEDLGGLLHAFAGPKPWDRLRATKIPDLDAAFRSVLADPRKTLHEAFRVPTDEHLRDEHLDDAGRLAFMRLRERVTDRWETMLQRPARLWLAHREVAKAMMHGFPLLAGEHVIGPPGAGELSDGMRWPSGLFAVAVTSSERDRHVSVNRHLIALDRDNVRRFDRDGRTAAKLAAELCSLHASSIMDGCAATLSTELLPTLSSDDQTRIKHLVAKPQEERGDADRDA